jgi:hypothetical protein
MIRGGLAGCKLRRARIPKCQKRRFLRVDI